MEKKVLLQKFTTRDVCYIGIFVAIISVCAYVSVPLGMVPFTLQTWAIMMAGAVLGAKRGVIAVIIYILLGAVGAPVFAGGLSGIGIIAGFRGGFIVTFPVLAFMAGIMRDKKIVYLAAGLVCGVIINLTVGMVWFSAVTQNNLQASFSTAVAPFILPEIFKIVAVIVVGKSVHAALAKAKISV
jgi:biotin transport system substrate-specific component